MSIFCWITIMLWWSPCWPVRVSWLVRSYKREASHAVYGNRVKCAAPASGSTFISGSVRWKSFSTNTKQEIVKHDTFLGDRLYMTTSFLGGCHQGRFIFRFNFSQLPSSWQVDLAINCSPFLICTGAVTSATILHSGETVSVTLALQLFAQLSTQLHCGHGGRLDIIVTRTVIKLRPEPTRPRESSRNHPVSQMHLCHRLLSPGKLWRKCELY